MGTCSTGSLDERRRRRIPRPSSKAQTSSAASTSLVSRPMRVAGSLPAGSLSRLRQRYRHARVRYGRHGSASSSSAAAPARRVEPVRAHRRVAHPEVTRRQHVRPVQGEHQEHVRGPLADPLDRVSSRITSSSGSSLSRSSSSSPDEHVLGERAQVGDLRAREAAGGAQLLGVVGEDLLRRRRLAVEALAAARAVDRRGRLHRQLLAGDPAHERAVHLLRAARGCRAPRAAGRRSRRSAAPSRRRRGAGGRPGPARPRSLT